MKSLQTNLTRLLSQSESERLQRYKNNLTLAETIWEKIRELKNQTAGYNHNLHLAESHMLEFIEKLSEIVPRVTKYIEQGDKNERETGSRDFKISSFAPWNKFQKQSTSSSE